MNKLQEAEKYIKRSTLSEMMKTDRHYMSVIARSQDLSEAKEEALKAALKKIIKKLKALI